MVPAPYSTITVVPFVKAMGFDNAHADPMSASAPTKISELRITDRLHSQLTTPLRLRGDRVGYSVASDIRGWEAVRDAQDGARQPSARSPSERGNEGP